MVLQFCRAYKGQSLLCYNCDKLSFCCTFPFRTGTDVLVFIIQKLVESTDSLIALTAMKGLKCHPCLEVNMHSSTTRSESLLVGCFHIQNGNGKLS